VAVRAILTDVDTPKSTPAWWTLAAATALMVAAWLLAHHPPVPTPDGPAGFDSVSVGRRLLAVAGLPWLVQWAACAVLVGAVARYWARASWTAVLFGSLLHLAVGTAWWTGLAAMLWDRDPFEAVLDAVYWSAERSFGGESLGQFLLFEVGGPLLCPVRAGGLVTLQGWSFLWAGLSSILVMGYWTWVVQRLRRNRPTEPRARRRQFALSVALVAVYVSPMVIRATLRVATAAGWL